MIKTNNYPNLITPIEMGTNELQESKGLATPDVMGSAFSVDDRVHKQSKLGTVTRVSDKAVHVRYDDDYYEKFHFNSTHHMQTSITALKHYP